jgi:hypothetical protein
LPCIFWPIAEDAKTIAMVVAMPMMRNDRIVEYM